MFTITGRNVNENYQKGLRLLTIEGDKEPTRAGDVLVMRAPVTNVYQRPRERVLFDDKRDANPFFHIMEAVWMIAGRQDATLLDRYVSDFSKRFAEDDGNAHGAYGARWRNHFKIYDKYDWGYEAVDQLTEAGHLLRENPHSRQVVIAMWDPAEDLGAKKRDIPCNDLVMFRAVGGEGKWHLNMSIVARSHDAVWGAYGANIVHMTVMHETVAALANMEVGTYTHFSNNFHVYSEVLPRLGSFLRDGHWEQDPYESGAAYAQRIATNQEEAETFMTECEVLCDELKNSKPFSEPENSWLRDTVIPMLKSHGAFKEKQDEQALSMIEDVHSSDWRLAGRLWLQRRIDKRKQKEAAE